MKVALFGGTFDPPTTSHEAIVRSCLVLPDFDAVWVMPSGVRADKQAMTSADIRLQLLGCMKQSVFADDPRLVITDFDVTLPHPTQTLATVQALKGAYPEHEFWFVFGTDSYHDMPRWRGGAGLQASLPMLLVDRPGASRPPQSQHIRHLGVADGARALRISSTDVRRAVAAGRSVQGMVNPEVARCISRLRLYQAVQ